MGPSQAVLEQLEATPSQRWLGAVPALAAGAGVWEAAARLGWLGPVPPVSAVVQRLVALLQHDDLHHALAASLISLAMGVVAAWACGIATGAIFHHSRICHRLFHIYFDALMAVPGVVYVPVLFGLFGFSRATQLAVIFVFAYFTVAATTEMALDQVDTSLLSMGRAFGANRRQLFRMVQLPASAPLIVTGMRSGAVRAVKGMLIGEMLVAFTGLGALLKAYGARFDIGSTLALVLLIAIIGLAVNAIVDALGHAVVRRLSRPTFRLRMPATGTATETAARSR